MKKVIWILIALVLVVGIAYFVTRELTKNGNEENKVTNTSTSTNTQNNVKENKVTNTTTNKNNAVDNNTTNTVVDNSIANTTTNETSTETFDENPQTEEQKAISIVKKDWGANDVSVKISVEGINDNGAYRVTVRDSATTELRASYKVDVKSGTFEKKEIM